MHLIRQLQTLDPDMYSFPVELTKWHCYLAFTSWIYKVCKTNQFLNFI